MTRGSVNYYKVLHVSEDASYDDIKRSYRLLSKRYHPDTPEGNERIMSQLNEAYAVLSDPVKRHFYKIPSEKPQQDTWDEKPIWKQQTSRRSQQAHESDTTEHGSGWAIFFAYVLAIPIAILLVTVLTPIANRFFTRVTNNAVVQPGNVTATPAAPLNQQSQNDNSSQSGYHDRVYYR